MSEPGLVGASPNPRPFSARAKLAAIRALKDVSFAAFVGLDRLGVHVLPKHYYTPVPDLAWLRANRAAWQGPASLMGVDWDLDRQLRWLDETCRPFYGEVRGLKVYEHLSSDNFRYGQGYGPIESQVLHCFIRSCKPTRMVEIGSGLSTALAVHAARMNAAAGDRPTQITAVEPYPEAGLRSLADVQLVPKLCQDAPSEVFDQLEAGDLLFVDSSHAVKVGSDVMRIYFDVIPRLKPGVFVHIHDVNLPYLYYRDALSNYLSWQETALVAALLTGNRALEVLCCMSALHYARRTQLQEALDDYRPQADDHGLRAPTDRDPSRHFPSSLWLVTR